MLIRISMFLAVALLTATFLPGRQAAAREDTFGGAWKVMVDDAELADGQTASLVLAFVGHPVDFTVITAVGVRELRWLDAAGKQTRSSRKIASLQLHLVELRGEDQATAMARWELSPASRLAVLADRPREVSLIKLGVLETARYPVRVGPNAKATVVRLSEADRAALAKAQDAELAIRVRTFFSRTVGPADLVATLGGPVAKLMHGHGVTFTLPLLTAEVSNDETSFVLGSGEDAGAQRDRALSLLGPDLRLLNRERPGMTGVMLAPEGRQVLSRHLLADACKPVLRAKRKRERLVTVALPAGRFATVHMATYRKGSKLKRPARVRLLVQAAQAGGGSNSFYQSKLGIAIGTGPNAHPEGPLAQAEIGELLREIDEAMDRWLGAGEVIAYDLARVDAIVQPLVDRKAPAGFKPLQVEFFIDTFLDAAGEPYEDFRMELLEAGFR